MDSTVCSAVEEICFHGQAGVSFASLCSKLEISPFVKSPLWRNLLAIPALQFNDPNGAALILNEVPLQRVEDAEKLGVKIVADQRLRDNFIGLYDSSVNISSQQRRTLERLAIARTDGVTQSQLAKEFGIQGRNFFYIMKNLECRGLIVRQPAVVRTREPCPEGEQKNSSVVSTNLVYLYRYAKHLDSQQRFEISKEQQNHESLGSSNGSDTREDDLDGEHIKEDMFVNDYLPPMRAVCNKLNEANGKVLVVSDIKRDLGYSGPAGHRAWRNIYHRLKDAGLVEDFEAVVNQKVAIKKHGLCIKYQLFVHLRQRQTVPTVMVCIRLIKTFPEKEVELKSLGCHNKADNQQQLKFGRKVRNTDQILELPIESQMYDMVDAEGSEGLHSMKVRERLGIDKKRNYSQWFNMLPRFGMHLQAESHGKTTAYRVWTSRNWAHKSSKAISSICTVENHDNDTSNCAAASVDIPGDSAQMFLEYDHLSTPGDLGTPEINRKGIHAVSSGTPSHSEKDDRHATPQESAAPKLLLISDSDAFQKHSNQVQTADGARREQRILEWLQDEEFILKPELHRWLVELEKDRGTKLDRKTVDRILQKLQHQGYCKCIHINVPVVTNCGRSRITQVVLHPSVQDLHSELLSRVHDRLRSFEMQIRGHGSSKVKNNDSFPVLDGVQRTKNHEVLDTKAARFEAMRTNGFVLAKMVRAKLLHGFLWDYVSKCQGWDDTSLEDDGQTVSHGTCILFSLEAAISAIPFELFLQVVGSSQKFEYMIEKCKKGLCLFDLPKEEYRLLMDTQATGRLSLIIDILRRLKLIRLVIDDKSDQKVKVPHANLTHALELKPYIEEPVSVVAPNLFSFDLRPRVRHDFTLSKKEALNEYWLTLEYCYAAADPRAAVYAFPGSAVGEVFLFRSWASVRVMTADQRADLLKRIMKENPNGKVSFKECEKIAKELNLTFEQVLRVYCDKQQKRLNRFRGASDANMESPSVSAPSSTRKRKRSSNAILHIAESTRVDALSAHLDQQSLGREPHDIDKFKDNEDLPPEFSGEHDVALEAYQCDDHVEPVDKQGPDAYDIEYDFRISPSSSTKLKPIRNKRFSWTEMADRQLITQYARYRAALGAKFFRVDWASLPGLPALPKACARRMAGLKRSKQFRRPLMKLCNILGDRYQKHLQKSQDGSFDDHECRLLVRPSLKESLGNSSENHECGEAAGCRIEKWDDFDDENVKRAFEDVLQIKQIAKMEVSKRVGSVSEKWSNVDTDFESNDLQQPETLPATNHGENVESSGGGQHKDRSRSSSQRHVQQKLVRFWSEGPANGRQVKESVAVSNAVELFKLIFLSPSTAMGSANFLAETLRRYSECDLYAAFSYLRDRKIMIGGTGGQPFLLSQHFLYAISKSPFPRNAGKRASIFSAWLHDRRKDLTDGGFILTTDLQCGDIFCLFSLVSSGELSISPCLPNEGIGEAEDLRSWKRRAEECELLFNSDKAKKFKSISESELTSRREKGFPGVMVSVCRTAVSVSNALDLFRDQETSNNDVVNHERVGQDLGCSSSNSDCFGDTVEFGHVAPFSGEASWEVMAKYADRFMSEHSRPVQGCQFDPEVFKTVSSNIKRAGDQGLSIKDISGLLNISGDITGVIIDVLQAFGRAFKVNAYNAIRVVDALYRPKYFLISTASFNQKSTVSPSYESQKRNEVVNLLSCKESRSKLFPKDKTDDALAAANSLKGVSLDLGEAHRVTILNLPEEICAPSEYNTGSNMLEISVQGSPKSAEASNNGEASGSFYSESMMPIVTWINGDGTINRNVYNGLLRRILGIVMQNPGILEDDIICRMDVLNPQSCRQFLELMIRDRHLVVRKMLQTSVHGPPALLQSLVGSSSAKPKFVCREHFFANPTSTYVL